MVVLCLEMEVEEEKAIPVSKTFLYDSDTDAHAHTLTRLISSLVAVQNRTMGTTLYHTLQMH